MNKKRLSVIAMLAVLLLSLFTGCSKGGSTASSGTSAKDKTYLIACDAKYAPFSFEDNGKYKGIDVELIDAISKIEGFKYELKPMDFSGIIPAIVSGQIDGSIAGMNITEKRKESVDFSDGTSKLHHPLLLTRITQTSTSWMTLRARPPLLKKGQQVPHSRKTTSKSMASR